MFVAHGVDIVHIPTFASQLELPGTRFADVFSGAELRLARRRAATTGDLSPHLAARWAAKEAFIKAWSQSIFGQPPVIAPEAVAWEEIEVLADAYGRPYLNLCGEVARKFSASQPHAQVLLTISHDGDYATAYVVVVKNSSGPDSFSNNS